MNSVNSNTGPHVRMCPTCDIPLKEGGLHGEKVDKCTECGGIFFDKGELESILKIVRLYQSIKLDEPDIPNISDTEIKRIVKCPADLASMDPVIIAGVTIDICPKCKGIWLDRGEIVVLKMFENHIRRNLNLYIRLGN